MVFKISPESVSVNGKFHFRTFKNKVISITALGDEIHPKLLIRKAKDLGAPECELDRKLRDLFNGHDKRLKRRRSEYGGYCYEKIAN